MVIDDDPPAPSPNNADSSKKSKSLSKKVLFHSYPSEFFSYYRSSLHSHKVPEKRPEVRLLEYHEVPGILLGSKYYLVQKVLTAASKRPKLDSARDPCGKLFIHSDFHAI